VIFHSDRGCQYTSSVFDAYCTENKVRRSLGRTGICYDNALSESFFATYKKGNWTGPTGSVPIFPEPARRVGSITERMS
jgi:transposase InsO family protein